jgi:hypothetical protein
MNEQQLSNGTHAVLHADTVDALVSYIVDCNFEVSHLNAMNLALALEYAYQARPRFWQDFSVTYLVDALERPFPDWRTAVNKRDGGALGLIKDVEDILRINAFDEANAEMMLALPCAARPTTPSSAFAWISAALNEKRLTTQLKFAERDGNRCGEAALDVLDCLERAAKGMKADRIGTTVARAYRDAMVSLHSKRTVCAAKVAV